MEPLRVLDVVAVFVLGETVRMLEVERSGPPPPDSLVETIQHGEEVVIEPLWVERHLLGSDADGFDIAFRKRSEPTCDLGVVEDHRVSTGKQDLAELLPTGFRVDPTIGLDELVVRTDVGRDLGNLGQALLGHRAIMPLDVLAGDQFLMIAESVSRARGDHVHQTLQFSSAALDRCVVHLIARVLGPRHVVGLVGTGLHDC